MANFIAILSKITSLVNYSFYKIYIKSTLTLITYSGTISYIKSTYPEYTSLW